MNLQEYQYCLAQLHFGKRLPTALYVFRGDESDLGPALSQLLARIIAAFEIGSEFNVVKFRTDDLKVSFLAYPTPLIERHKTALTRYELSKPVKSLLEYGLLKSGSTFFDYGCGQGSDVRGLQALGHSAAGWDPVHQPDVAKQEADIVNLGYVLNVIEDPAERVEALVDANRHARRLLVVSGLIRETVQTEPAETCPVRASVLESPHRYSRLLRQLHARP